MDNPPNSCGPVSERPLIFLVSTTQRCGSTWLTRLLNEMTGSRSVYLDCTALGFHLFRKSAEAAVENFRSSSAAIGSRVIKTHDIPCKDFDAVCAAVPNLRLLTLSRGFKDIFISRYFYYRCYWPTDPRLGPLSETLASVLDPLTGLPDELALPAVARSKLVRNWAREWAAFEGEFQSGNIKRLRYESMLAGIDERDLERFTGLPFPKLNPFADEQALETTVSGRSGSARFNREGRSGQWKKWLSDEDSAHIDSVVEGVLETKRRLGTLEDKTDRTPPPNL